MTRRSGIGDEERVVITGLGAVTALGSSARESWERLIAGECGIREVTLFPVDEYRTRIAAEVVTDEAEGLSPYERRRTARTDRIAIRSAREALADAGLPAGSVAPERGAVVLGAGASGLFESESYLRDLVRHGPRRARVSKTLSYFPSAATDWVAAKTGFMAFRSTVVTACSSSAIAIGQGFDLVRRGRADVAIAGGADTLSLLTFAGFNSLRATDTVPCRPFDRDRAGLSLGEAGAMLVLESAARARRRGARIYAEVLGYGVRCDAYHMTAPDPDGDGAARTMRDALRMARVDASDAEHVNAHGTATPYNDKTETLAIKSVFGERAPRLMVSSVKGAFGHCLGAAGAIEAVTLALSLHHGIVPPTLHHENADPECDLDCVPNQARETRLGIGISNSFAFGGNNATLVFGRFDG